LGTLASLAILSISSFFFMVTPYLCVCRSGTVPE
jgi:hypothetical protein